MDELITGIGGAGGGGVVGVILAWLGFKSKVCSIERRLSGLSDNVRYEDTCEKICGAMEKRLEGIEGMQKEMRDDVKELLGRK